MPRFDAYEDLVGRWRWRLLGGDGAPLASSGESFETQWQALIAAEDVRGAATEAQISNLPADGVGDALAAIIDRELVSG